jgi:hypothetical protein
LWPIDGLLPAETRYSSSTKPSQHRSSAFSIAVSCHGHQTHGYAGSLIGVSVVPERIILPSFPPPYEDGFPAEGDLVPSQEINIPDEVFWTGCIILFVVAVVYLARVYSQGGFYSIFSHRYSSLSARLKHYAKTLLMILGVVLLAPILMVFLMFCLGFAIDFLFDHLGRTGFMTCFFLLGYSVAALLVWRGTASVRRRHFRRRSHRPRLTARLI